MLQAERDELCVEETRQVETNAAEVRRLEDFGRSRVANVESQSLHRVVLPECMRPTLFEDEVSTSFEAQHAEEQLRRASAHWQATEEQWLEAEAVFEDAHEECQLAVSSEGSAVDMEEVVRRRTEFLAQHVDELRLRTECMSREVHDLSSTRDFCEKLVSERDELQRSLRQSEVRHEAAAARLGAAVSELERQRGRLQNEGSSKLKEFARFEDTLKMECAAIMAEACSHEEEGRARIRLQRRRLAEVRRVAGLRKANAAAKGKTTFEDTELRNATDRRAVEDATSRSKSEVSRLRVGLDGTSALLGRARDRSSSFEQAEVQFRNTIATLEGRLEFQRAESAKLQAATQAEAQEFEAVRRARLEHEARNRAELAEDAAQLEDRKSMITCLDTLRRT